MDSLSAALAYYWNEFKKPLVVLALLLLIAAGVYFFAGVTPPPQEEVVDTSLDTNIRLGKAPIPAMTEEMQAKLAASKGFSALVSYTQNGFEPRTVTIARGEAVRFTNNSAGDLWVSAGGEGVLIYPQTKAGCGSSDLDSCSPFPPQDFWEFTFEEVGSWQVVNNLDKSKRGTIIVE
jgi:plastocyanin